MDLSLTEVIHADASVCVLSSEINIYKTERFLKETGRACDVDDFIGKIGEALIGEFYKLRALRELLPKDKRAFRLQTEDGEHTLFFVIGEKLTGKNDIVFYKYVGRDGVIKQSDLRFDNYLQMFKKFDLVLSQETSAPSERDLQKLYRLSNSDRVNFPLLNAEQKKIVGLEDQNVLVQGVAGSGKTNICIDKIVFAACRGYRSRVLYSTYSRGLLLDTKARVEVFKNNAIDFLKAYEGKKVVFTDKNHKKAIENKLGIYFSVDDDDKIASKIREIIAFLDVNVDYRLLEDIYKDYFSDSKEKVVGESYFIKEYVGNIKNHQLAVRLQKIKSLTYEVIYKEIYGLIFGFYDLNNPSEMISLDAYGKLRNGSFSRSECETVYAVALDYAAELQNEGLIDNNIVSRRVLSVASDHPKYSLAILDEVQDMTEVNLCLIKKLARKVFCVGDALQMINPAYFSFGYLKRLLYEKDVVSVAELKHNYRSTQKIAEIIERLGEINVGKFGTHSFVLNGVGVESDTPTSACFVADDGFIEAVAKEKFANVTVICAGQQSKEELRKVLRKQEILTVSEAKGLEREAVIAYDLISDNIDKWEALERTLVNRKRADENSVYRYYFNLFYVGISRARSHIYVCESRDTDTFRGFFNDNFKRLDLKSALSALGDVAVKLNVDREETLRRVEEFIRLGQYNNAAFAASKLEDEAEKAGWIARVDVNKQFISHGEYRNAGVAFWKKNMYEDAKKMFALSGDVSLLKLMDAVSGRDSVGLDVDILRFYDDFADNDAALELVTQVVSDDLAALKNNQRDINKKLKLTKEKKYGK